MTPSDFAWALGMTESGGSAWAPMHDNGCAMGRFQVHPDRLWFEAHRHAIQPLLSETWDGFVMRVVEAMYRWGTSAGHSALAIAMYWHLGHFALVTDDDWDEEYASRFAKYQVRQLPPIHV